jgi:hypothetical protein
MESEALNSLHTSLLTGIALQLSSHCTVHVHFTPHAFGSLSHVSQKLIGKSGHSQKLHIHVAVWLFVGSHTLTLAPSAVDTKIWFSCDEK